VRESQTDKHIIAKWNENEQKGMTTQGIKPGPAVIPLQA